MNNYPEGYEPRLFLAKACEELGAEVDYDSPSCAMDGKVTHLMLSTDTVVIPGFTVNDRVVVYLLDNRMPALLGQNDAAKQIRSLQDGIVCCAQKTDAEKHGFHWLPLAVTPAYVPECDSLDEIAPLRHYRAGYPKSTILEMTVGGEPEFDFAFVGYLNDKPRSSLMDRVLDNFKGNIQSGVFGDEAVMAYRQAKIGLNIPAFFGTTFAHDVNMRVFEIASISRVLVSANTSGNGMTELGFISGKNYLGYINYYEMASAMNVLLASPMLRDDLAGAAMELVVDKHLYKHRAQRLLELIDGSE